jgi:predicted NAD-dependent protein-ADP-ribosyltransferase YbiA (DUF1768 family)
MLKINNSIYFDKFNFLSPYSIHCMEINNNEYVFPSDYYHHMKMKAKFSGEKYSQEEWDSLRDELMFKACYQKFYYNCKLQQKLLKTIPYELVFIDDRMYWGTGPTNDITDRHQWRGKNKLGEILERLRRELSEEKNLSDEASSQNEV